MLLIEPFLFRCVFSNDITKWKGYFCLTYNWWFIDLFFYISCWGKKYIYALRSQTRANKYDSLTGGTAMPHDKLTVENIFTLTLSNLSYPFLFLFSYFFLHYFCTSSPFCPFSLWSPSHLSSLSACFYSPSSPVSPCLPHYRRQIFIQIFSLSYTHFTLSSPPYSSLFSPSCPIFFACTSPSTFSSLSLSSPSYLSFVFPCFFLPLLIFLLFTFLFLVLVIHYPSCSLHSYFLSPS